MSTEYQVLSTRYGNIAQRWNDILFERVDDSYNEEEYDFYLRDMYTVYNTLIYLNDSPSFTICHSILDKIDKYLLKLSLMIVSEAPTEDLEIMHAPIAREALSNVV